MSCKYFSKRRSRALNAVTCKQDENTNMPIRENQNYMDRSDNKENNDKSQFKSGTSNKKLYNKLSSKQMNDMQNDRLYEDGTKKFQTPGNKESKIYSRFNNVMMSADR